MTIIMTPNVMLARPYVMLLEAQSVLGLIVGNAQCLFGLVVKVFETTDIVSINQYWLFDVTKAAIIYNDIGETYYVVDQRDLIFKENYAPPP